MTVATLLIIATLLPLLSFTILVFVGKRMGNPLAGWVATFAIGGSFVCSVLALMFWIWTTGAPKSEIGQTGAAGTSWGIRPGTPIRIPVLKTVNWLPVDQHGGVAGFLQMGIYVDSLTVAMFAMITLVSTAVHIFSLGYMAEDKRFPRFFTYLGLFCFSMLGLVIGGTILQLFVFWELVGLCSYLLIGFWYEKKSASDAAIKAFVTNRVGDFGFLIGLGILFYHLGNVTLPDVWRILDLSKMTAEGIEVNGALFTPTLLTIMGIGLFFGAVGKSAQFPLHVWLPDAMEGPTPVSALIHAATMVAAGVYLVGRIFPILTPDARLFIAIIGVTTLTMAALIAVVQSDIKKVLAFSTLSQLGYMILAMGVGSWVGGLFHLITHAFFKALLFLGAGSVIMAAHHEQELPQYGGLWRKIPITALTFAIAVLAIAGTPFFSGYYSKDMILSHAGAFAAWATEEHRSTWYWAFFILPTVVAYITAFYMTRCWMLTFWGKPRNQHLYDHAHERPLMYIPLIGLAVLAIIGGTAIGVRSLLVHAVLEPVAYYQKEQPSVDFKGFAQAWPDQVHHTNRAPSEDEPAASPASTPEKVAPARAAQEHGEHIMHQATLYGGVAGVGILLGILMYVRGYAVANALMKFPPLRWIHTWLYRRMYFDDLYNTIFVGLVFLISSISGWFDKYVVDGLVNLAGWVVRRLSWLSGLNDKYVVDGAVTGVADLTQDVGTLARLPQTGRIRMYVTVLLGAVAIMISGAIVAVVVLSR